MISPSSSDPADRIYRTEYHPFVVTAAINDDDLRPYESLRRQYFPRKRNFISADLTIFHALPGASAPKIMASLDWTCRSCKAIVLDVIGVKLFDAGVAFVLESEDSRQLSDSLRRQFEPWLTRQDAKRWQPHITIQNKVAPAAARCHADLAAAFKRDR